MYYNHNVIPLIFGNKATVEFRIHTPTFDVNKVIPFVVINSMLINFTTKYQDVILKDPRFIVQYNIKSIISDMMRDTKVSNSNTLHESLLYYVDDRRKYTEDQNRKGLVKGKEDSIPKCRHIDWGYVKPIPKKIIEDDVKVDVDRLLSNEISIRQAKADEYIRKSIEGNSKERLEMIFTKELNDRLKKELERNHPLK